ncbi:MAG: hypothetical protein ACKOGA_22195, partial [Planctomycetaceae bacterium]
GYGPFTAAQIHLGIALGTIVIHLVVYWFEFLALRRNGQLVDQVLQQVRQIRLERGLPVD